MNGRRKIAILGGGVGAMTTAYEITNQPGWQDHYEVSLYTLGWRLGGKGATGRNAEIADRIEEHGLHVWFGFYENAFQMMRHVYDEMSALDLAPASPLQSCFDAFQPHDRICAYSQNGDAWFTDFPVRPGLPGDDRLFRTDSAAAPPTPAEYMPSIFNWMHDELNRASGSRGAAVTGADVPMSVRAVLRLLRIPLDLKSGIVDALMRACKAIVGIAGWHASRLHQTALVTLLDHFRQRVFDAIAHRAGQDPTLMHLLYTIDLYGSMARGFIDDDIINRGFESIDGYNLKDWLAKHGAVYPLSPLVLGAYDPCFAYENGDFSKPNIAAGTAIRGHLRLTFTYHGHVAWTMQAGMGDTIFGPLYLVLKNRGVRFRFFQRVRDLGLSPDGRAIDSLAIEPQASLGGPEYAPLVSVKGLPCWPSKPLYGQLEDYEDPRLLERSAPRGSMGHPNTVLSRGRDFDDVVLAIPVSVLPSICGRLIARDPRWAAMVNRLATVPTQAIQLWLKKSAAAMGWDGGAPWPEYNRGIACGYVEPFDSVADFSHVIPYERWEPEDGVRHVAYFCNAMAPAGDPEDQEAQTRRVHANAVSFLTDHLRALFPTGTLGQSEELDWDLLVDRENRMGSDRFAAQYVRANTDPTELYVQTLAGTNQFRLAPDQSGFANLYLAGDWTDNEINVGCVEAAVIAGRTAAKAICGLPRKIYCSTRWRAAAATGGP